MPILTQTFEFGRIVLQDDTCFTTDQQVEEVASLMHNLGELTSTFSGFEKKWDSVSVGEHISCSEFKDEIWGWYYDNNMPTYQIFQENWPKLTYTLGNLNTELQYVGGIIDVIMQHILEAYMSFVDVVEGDFMWIGDRIGDAFSPIYNLFHKSSDFDDYYFDDEFAVPDYGFDDPWFNYDYDYYV